MNSLRRSAFARVGMLAFLAVALIMSAATSRAQSLFYAKSGGSFRLVKRVARNTPFVDDGGGKLVAADLVYTLRPVAEYLPKFVSVHNLEVSNRSLNLEVGGQSISREMDFVADFESPFALEDVFVVFELNSEAAGHELFIQGVGDLAPRESRHIEAVVPLTDSPGKGHFKLRVFSGGAEVLNSEMPFTAIERALDTSVRNRIRNLENAPVQPFVGPAPEYPPQLRSAKVSGRAVIHFKVGYRGQVVDPAVQSATDPAFGESALAAARMWRFLPRMVDGHPVETEVNMPFVFSPPRAN